MNEDDHSLVRSWKVESEAVLKGWISGSNSIKKDYKSRGEKFGFLSDSSGKNFQPRGVLLIPCGLPSLSGMAFHRIDDLQKRKSVKKSDGH